MAAFRAVLALAAAHAALAQTFIILDNNSTCPPAWHCPWAGTDKLPTYYVPSPKCQMKRLNGRWCKDRQGPNEPVPCKEGSFCPTVHSQLPCPEGYFCQQGTVEPVECPWHASCPEGTVVPFSFLYLGVALALDIIVVAFTAYTWIYPVDVRLSHWRSACGRRAEPQTHPQCVAEGATAAVEAAPVGSTLSSKSVEWCTPSDAPEGGPPTCGGGTLPPPQAGPARAPPSSGAVSAFALEEGKDEEGEEEQPGSLTAGLSHAVAPHSAPADVARSAGPPPARAGSGVGHPVSRSGSSVSVPAAHGSEVGGSHLSLPTVVSTRVRQDGSFARPGSQRFSALNVTRPPSSGSFGSFRSRPNKSTRLRARSTAPQQHSKRSAYTPSPSAASPAPAPAAASAPTADPSKISRKKWKRHLRLRPRPSVELSREVRWRVDASVFAQHAGRALPNHTSSASGDGTSTASSFVSVGRMLGRMGLARRWTTSTSAASGQASPAMRRHGTVDSVAVASPAATGAGSALRTLASTASGRDGARTVSSVAALSLQLRKLRVQARGEGRVRRELDVAPLVEREPPAAEQTRFAAARLREVLTAARPGARNVSLTYHGLEVQLPNGVVLLHGASGGIASGRVTAILGPSGSGKTTLLSLLLGRHPTGCTVQGEVRANGVRMTQRVRQALVGFVPQADVMLPELTPWEATLYSARCRLPWSSTSLAPALCQAALDTLGIEHVENVAVGDERRRGLSGGEKKRVNVALELVAAPRVCALDEPTSGLDASAALHLINTLRTLAHEAGLAIVMAVHQPRVEAFELFDDVIIMSRGGHMVYVGEREGAIPFFASRGVDFSGPSNPADVILDAVAGDPARFLSEDKPAGSGAVVGESKGIADEVIVEEEEGEDECSEEAKESGSTLSTTSRESRTEDHPGILTHDTDPLSRAPAEHRVLASISRAPPAAAAQSPASGVGTPDAERAGGKPGAPSTAPPVTAAGAEPRPADRAVADRAAGVASVGVTSQSRPRSSSRTPAAVSPLPTPATVAMSPRRAEKVQGGEEEAVEVAELPPLWWHVWLAVKRSALQQARRPGLLLVDIACALLAGAISAEGYAAYEGTWYKGPLLARRFSLLSPALKQDRLFNLVFVHNLSLGLAIGPTAIRHFGPERLMYEREMKRGHSRFAYFLSKFLVISVPMAISVVNFAGMAYVIGRPPMPLADWLPAMMAHGFAAQSVGVLVSMVLSPAPAGVVSAIGIMLFNFAGASGPLRSDWKDRGLAWLVDLTPVRWSTEATVTLALEHVGHFYDLDSFHEVFGLTLGRYWVDVAAIMVCSLVLRVLSVALVWKVPSSVST